MGGVARAFAAAGLRAPYGLTWSRVLHKTSLRVSIEIEAIVRAGHRQAAARVALLDVKRIVDRKPTMIRAAPLAA